MVPELRGAARKQKALAVISIRPHTFYTHASP